MEEFSKSVESARIREDLINAISGKGAFRYFKDTIRRYGIEKNCTRSEPRPSGRSPSIGAKSISSRGNDRIRPRY